MDCLCQATDTVVMIFYCHGRPQLAIQLHGTSLRRSLLVHGLDLQLTIFLCCSDISDRHRRLAEITEMIHTASLVHDDVLDECSLRRGEHQALSICRQMLVQVKLR